MNGLKHVMVDIETLGTGRDAAIMSIGAVQFDPHQDRVGEPLAAFYMRVDLARSLHPGTIDPATVEWWLKQSDEARAALVAEPRIDLQQALHAFRGWLACIGEAAELRLWSNGPTFDERILREAFDRHGLVFPVSFRGSRCMRTICALAGELGLDVPERAERASLKHDALSDALHQANVVCAITQAMRKAVSA